MPISDAEHDRALATILGADGLYLADEVRDVAAVLASHLIERFEAAYQVAHAYVDARDLRPPTRAELADLAATATTAKLLAAAIRHAHTFIRSTG